MRSRLGVALWCAIVAAPAAAAWFVLVPIREPAHPSPRIALRAASVAQSRPRGSPDSLARLAAMRAPFRASRTPPDLAYDPAAPRTGDAMPPPAPKPPLVLTGIVWGAEPAALIEGLPGTTAARVVRRGDVVGKLVIGRITRDRVTVTGMDTTWMLSVREVGR
jgi:hypothetical protein